MSRFVITLKVEVDKDQVPGFGYSSVDFVDYIRDTLNRTIPHYNPTVQVEHVLIKAKE